MRLNTLFLLKLLSLILLMSLPATAADDRVAIQGVIEQFRTAMIAKGQRKFMDTFLHQQVTWQAATSDERLAHEIKTDPEASKVFYDPKQTPEQFIDGIVRSAASIEETFADIKIDTDGTVAAVAFNFEFLQHGKAINAGREYWLLVKTADGWKIAAVTWSRNTPVT